MIPVPEPPEIIKGTVYDNYWLSSPTLMSSVSNDNNNNDNNNNDENNRKGIFEAVGISQHTNESLAGCNLPKSRVINKIVEGLTHKVKLPLQWVALPILPKKEYRMFGGDFIMLCLECVRKVNSLCSFSITSNYVKKDDSRKKSSNFFTGKGRCKMEGCPCKFIAVQKSKNDTHMTIEFVGNIIHDITKPTARQIRGKERKKEKEKYLTNLKLNPTDVFREKLHLVPPISFACGNRDGAEISKKTHQNIKCEAIRGINSFDILRKEILNLQKRLHDEDSKWCLDNEMTFRLFFWIYTNIFCHKRSFEGSIVS